MALDLNRFKKQTTVATTLSSLSTSTQSPAIINEPIPASTPVTITNITEQSSQHNHTVAANNQTVALDSNNSDKNSTTASTSELDYIVLQSLAALTQKMEAQLPDVRTEMITIHKALAKDPAQVTILTPEQQAIIFAGYSKLTGIELVAAAAKKKGSTKASAVTIDMFD